MWPTHPGKPWAGRRITPSSSNYSLPVPGGLLSVGPTPTRRKTEGPLASWLYRGREVRQQPREGNSIHCLLWQELFPSFCVLFWAVFFTIRSFHLLAVDSAGYMDFEKMPASSCFLGGGISPPTNCILLLHNLAYWSFSNLPRSGTYLCKTKQTRVFRKKKFK